MRKYIKSPPIHTQCILKIPKVLKKRPKIYKDVDGVLLGEAYPEEFKIWIEEKQSSKEYLNSCIHESMHCIFPDLKEHQVSKLSGILTGVIWSRGYRRIRR